ncbi:MAG: hypothetical protein JWP81_1961 [Ferruginibacter sp.]|nr:hypothetical protein [Ferruginibacter sp.]
MPDKLLHDITSLLLQVGEGNEPAFRVIFDIYKERFYVASLKMTHSGDIAEEIVQEVFISLWINRTKVAAATNPQAYLFGILHNSIYANFRKLALEKAMKKTVEQQSTGTEENHKYQWICQLLAGQRFGGCGCGKFLLAMLFNGPGTYMGGGLYIATEKLKNSFDANDPRLPLTLNTSNNNITRYVLRDQPEGPCNSRNNVRILRYADVLLLKAEAVLQSSGSTAEAIGYINQVRTRARNMVAGGTQPANFNTAATDKAVIMQWIMDERLRELAGEGQRWFDLRRWAIGGTITLNNNFFNSVNSTKMAWDNHFLYFPIPNSETDKNSNIIQNPGY